jgi:dTDP-4-amino-4,6-dideoxygalactose transaminase
MAVTHPAAVRTILADAVVDSIDTGGAGSLIVQTSGDVEVATLTFSATAFGAASGPTATAAAITSDTNATGGTVAKFKIQNGAAADAGFAGAVSTSGSDINLSSLAVGAGDTVSISSLTYTASV